MARKKRRSTQSLATLRRKALVITQHELVDSGDHIGEIASELAQAIVYGKKPMSKKDLIRTAEDYDEARREFGGQIEDY